MWTWPGTGTGPETELGTELGRPEHLPQLDHCVSLGMEQGLEYYTGGHFISLVMVHGLELCTVGCLVSPCRKLILEVNH